MKNNTVTWVIVGILAIAVVVLALIFGGKGPAPETEVPVTTAPESTLDTTGDTPVSGATGTGTGTAVSLSYQQALAKYVGRRLQFNDACQASAPNVVTYKDNSGIMLDNRSNVTRTIKVGTTYTIKPYGFRIVVLPDIYLKAATLLVDCDKMQNVATVLVQE